MYINPTPWKVMRHLVSPELAEDIYVMTSLIHFLDQVGGRQTALTSEGLHCAGSIELLLLSKMLCGAALTDAQCNVQKQVPHGSPGEVPLA